MKFQGGKLRELRKARSWDQHRLAQAAREHSTGVTQASVSRYENGMEPSGRNAVALAKALGVRVDDLYATDDDEEPASMPSTAEMLEALRPLAVLLEKALA